MRKTWMILWVAALAPVSGWGFEKPLHQYSVYLPAGDGVCDRIASEMARDFGAERGVERSEAKCLPVTSVNWDGSPQRLYPIVVSYRAESPVKVTRTRYGFSNGGGSWANQPSDAYGAYATYAECVVARAVKSGEVARLTGLKPFAAYCSPAIYGKPGSKYVLNVESLGVARARLFYLGFDFYLGVVGAQDLAQIEQFMSSQGAEVVAQLGTSYLYYSAEPLSLNHLALGEVLSQPQCEEQLESVRSALRKVSADENNPALALCVPKSIGNGRTSKLEIIYGNYAPEAKVELLKDPRGYFSFEDCMRDRDRALEDQRRMAEKDRKILGAFCGLIDLPTSEFVYEMKILSAETRARWILPQE